MDAWALIFMVVILKIPLVAALFIIWYAIKEPAPEEEADGGLRGPRRDPKPRRPRPPRRPAGGIGCRPPPCPQLTRAHAHRPVPARR
jgi:hypothetical protein